MRDAVGASRCAARPQRRWLQRCAAAAAAPPAVATPPQAADHDGAVRAARLRGAGPGLALYDPAALEAEFGGAPLAVAARLADASSRLGAVLLRLAGDWATGSLGAAMRTRASELRTALTRLGPAAVKLGQLLSTRPDLLPGPYLEELARLQDALPGFPDAQAFELIEAELGAPLPALYRRITAKPIAAASLGQVYKAELLDGTPVAVKARAQRTGRAGAHSFSSHSFIPSPSLAPSHRSPGAAPRAGVRRAAGLFPHPAGVPPAGRAPAGPRHQPDRRLRRVRRQNLRRA